MPAERKYTWNDREKASELYVYQGATLEDVAEQLNIPLGTIKRWAADDNWQENQAQYWEVRRDTKLYLARAKLEILKQIVDSKDFSLATSAAAIIRADTSMKNSLSKQDVTQAADQISQAAKAKGLTPQKAEEIRNQILGILDDEQA